MRRTIRAYGASLDGTGALLVTVEARFEPAKEGGTEIHLSGLPDSVLRESRGRLSCVLGATGLGLGAGRLFLHLVPAARREVRRGPRPRPRGGRRRRRGAPHPTSGRRRPLPRRGRHRRSAPRRPRRSRLRRGGAPRGDPQGHRTDRDRRGSRRPPGHDGPRRRTRGRGPVPPHPRSVRSGPPRDLAASLDPDSGASPERLDEVRARPRRSWLSRWRPPVATASS